MTRRRTGGGGGGGRRRAGGGGGGGAHRSDGSSSSSGRNNQIKLKQTPGRRRRHNGTRNKTDGGGGVKHSLPHQRKQQRERFPKKNIQKQRKDTTNGNRPTTLVRSLTHSVNVSRHSIHNAWKRELGGLIRWYVNLPDVRNNNNNNNHDDEAIKIIENLYTSCNCNVQATRENLLQLIASTTNDDNAKSRPTNQWLDIRMVVENPHFVASSSTLESSSTTTTSTTTTVTIDNIIYDTILYGKGVILKTTTRPGDGPAHASNQWTVVVIPTWAVGRSFYFEFVNHSPLDLSCEMTIDGYSAAKNAPLPSHNRRTIRPASHRYYETHEWRLTPSQRIPLQQSLHPIAGGHSSDQCQSQQQQQQQQQQQNPSNSSYSRESSHRYNEKRPFNKGQRVSYAKFPDPSDFGWKFTGSHEESSVEFFEKRLNNGDTCRMDFYYTTGTVKTVLYHPTQQRTTQLFRKCCLAEDPDIFRQILQNPRYHSGLGYRRRRPSPANQKEMPAQEDSNGDVTMEGEAAKTNNGDSNEQGRMEEDNGGAANPVEEQPATTYFAKNDDYVFDKAGHAHRKAAMSQLQPTPEFQAWERATRQDWACVHAKCYVSMRRYMHSSGILESRGGRHGRNEDERMVLPEMAPIVNVQAAQNATLSTKFHAIGLSTNMQRKSRVRMERIKGLNDDPEWGTGPVFDLKLYYRAEIDATRNEEEDGPILDGDEEEDDKNTAMDEDDDTMIPLAEKLRNEMPLEVYKSEKTDQLHRWYQECKAANKDEADTKVIETQRNIEAAMNTKTVDDHLKIYWDWHVQQEWLSPS